MTHFLKCFNQFYIVILYYEFFVLSRKFFFNFKENNNSFPTDNKVILTRLQGAEEIKKYMKKVMPFVAFVKV